MQSKQITLYVVPDCSLCADMRAVLHDLQIEYIERDVANDNAALRRMYRLTRQGLVPTLEYNGKAAVRPDRKELEDLLNA